VYVCTLEGLGRVAEIRSRVCGADTRMAMALSYCTKRDLYGGGVMVVVVSLSTEESATL
jgi:hypothetical protein